MVNCLVINLAIDYGTFFEYHNNTNKRAKLVMQNHLKKVYVGNKIHTGTIDT